MPVIPAELVHSNPGLDTEQINPPIGEHPVRKLTGLRWSKPVEGRQLLLAGLIPPDPLRREHGNSQLERPLLHS